MSCCDGRCQSLFQHRLDVIQEGMQVWNTQIPCIGVTDSGQTISHGLISRMRGTQYKAKRMTFKSIPLCIFMSLCPKITRDTRRNFEPGNSGVEFIARRSQNARLVIARMSKKTYRFTRLIRSEERRVGKE